MGTPYNSAMTFGVLLRQARRAAKMRQEDVADAIGVDQTTVSKWENGTQAPESRYFTSLATFLGVDEEAVVTSIYNNGFGRGRLDALSTELSDLRADVQARLDATDERLAALEALLAQQGRRRASGSQDQ